MPFLAAFIVAAQLVSTTADVIGGFPALPAGGSAFLHISDTHADPLYNISLYSCNSASYKFVRSSIYIDDGGGEQYQDRCVPGSTPVGPVCPADMDTAAEVLANWESKVATGAGCPCGVADANSPFTVLKAVRSVIDQYATSGAGTGVVASKPTIVYSGDFASHYLPGHADLSRTCGMAKAVVIATMELLNSNVNNVNHMFSLGNNDVIPKRQPLEQPWVDELGVNLKRMGWLSDAELVTWNLGAFYRRVHGDGLCTIVLNSNSWTPTQINYEMQAKQEAWLPGAMTVDADCKRFMFNTHIAIDFPAEGKGAAGYAANECCWDAKKMDTTAAGRLRKIIADSNVPIVGEFCGDVNKEYLMSMGAGDSSWAVTAVGVSARGGNSPGFQRVIFNSGNTKVMDVESYRLKTNGCAFELGHTFKQAYAPYFNNGVDAAAVALAAKDSALDAARADNIKPNRGIKKSLVKDAFKGKNPAFLASVRAGTAGCSPYFAAPVATATPTETPTETRELSLSDPPYFKRTFRGRNGIHPTCH